MFQGPDEKRTLDIRKIMSAMGLDENKLELRETDFARTLLHDSLEQEMPSGKRHLLKIPG